MIAVNSFVTSDRLPPMNVEAEEMVLGGILSYPQSVSMVADKLLPEHFALKSYQQIHRAILSVFNSGKQPDLMQVTTYLYDRGLLDSIGGQSKLAQLVDCTISAINIDQYAELIIEKYLRRKVIQLGSEISSAGYETSTDLQELVSWVQEQTYYTTQTALDGGLRDAKAFKHQQIISQVSKLELEEENPSFRYFKLIDIAKNSGLSVSQLETIYYKHLINDENEPAIPLAEFRKKYGASVNRWFLHGFLSEGKVSLFYGKGGVGKTRLIYDLIHSVANGRSWNGFPVTARSRNILLVQTDESQGDMLEAFNARGITDDMPIMCKSRWTVDHIQQLKKEIIELGINWVVIDSLTAVSSNSIYSENDVPYARPILLLKALAQELGIHISIIHHAVSDGSKPRGTTAIVNAVSDVFCVAAKCDAQRPDSLNRLLKVEKSRSRAPGIYELLFDPEDNSWLLLGKQGEEESDSPNLTIKDKIIGFLQNHPNICYEVAEIQEAIGGNLESIRRCANQLARDGEISCKRLPSGAKGYWIALDGDEHPTYNPPDRDKIANIKIALRAASIEEEDRPMIAQEDRPQNDGLAVLSGIRDHPIIEPLNSSTEKFSSMEDRMIADAGNPHHEAVPQAILPGDPQAILGDHPPQPWYHEKIEKPYEQPPAPFTTGQKVRYEGTEYTVKSATHTHTQLDGIEKAVSNSEVSAAPGVGEENAIAAPGAENPTPLHVLINTPLKNRLFDSALVEASIDDVRLALQKVEAKPRGNSMRIDRLRQRLSELKKIEIAEPTICKYKGWEGRFKATREGIEVVAIRPDGAESEPIQLSFKFFEVAISWFKAGVDSEFKGGC
ncbi:AAA family ATPase [Trichocoleus sp. FACHB-90]|uniref:DnaB-like helicase N-terminal domain-containing protein n=1 Tax=Cyanophyceae TaxID=3028117 RepID=UPI001689ECCE|nr:DnaB-like helicase N-terminal domain-containing protein [Trichocoleus sp. FACHB-90]MBD1926486.1 AAA family ATPase [Trichocoleus sp. FACHB-90]